MTKGNPRITLRLPQEDIDLLKAAAAQAGEPLSEYCRVAIQRRWHDGQTHLKATGLMPGVWRSLYEGALKTPEAVEAAQQAISEMSGYLKVEDLLAEMSEATEVKVASKRPTRNDMINGRGSR